MRRRDSSVGRYHTGEVVSGREAVGIYLSVVGLSCDVMEEE